MDVRRDGVMRGAARAAVALALALAAAACRSGPGRVTPAGATFVTAVAGEDWSLLELGGRPVPGGAGGKRPTIRFESTAGRVTGFTGCNDYRGTYELRHDTLKLEPPSMTRIACTIGTDLERRFLAALAATERYRIAGGDLLLLGSGDVVARFTRGGN